MPHDLKECIYTYPLKAHRRHKDRPNGSTSQLRQARRYGKPANIRCPRSRSAKCAEDAAWSRTPASRPRQYEMTLTDTPFLICRKVLEEAAYDL